ncbi:hypothetical protein NDN08_004667 [Rhodosorus marinus]|uniref:Uncharacterized protein n=1 Tax=Rhodosorus marinus TaxID=101924 RepID=A0AAV8UR43_9RHOD|nr:hypothetical protein NDN08_004667 [Rhodosorus marinus]
MGGLMDGVNVVQQIHSYVNGPYKQVSEMVLKFVEPVDVKLVKPVDWVGITDEQKVTLLSKVMVMYELRDRKRPATSTTSVYSKASQAVMLLTYQKKATYAETVLGIVAAAYDALTPEFDSEELEELLDSWKNSQLVQDGVQFIKEKYEKEMKHASQKNTMAALKEAIALIESLLRSIPAEGDPKKQLPPAEREASVEETAKPAKVIRRRTIEGDPVEALRKVKEEMAVWAAFKRASKERGEKRPVPDLEWSKKDFQLREALVRAQKDVQLASNLRYRKENA